MTAQHRSTSRWEKAALASPADRSRDIATNSPDDPPAGWRRRPSRRASGVIHSPLVAFASMSDSSSSDSEPRRDANHPAVASTRHQERKRAYCKVLIVEDDPTSAMAMRSILTRKGCDVLVAINLAQGLELLEQRPTHVLLDLMLPDGQGVEILRRLREMNSAVKVVVTTAANDANLLREVHLLSPHRILKKPIDLVDLLNAIGMM
jgi:CheY-like chemotaxis protein